MVGIEADPLAGKEHILLSNLIHHAWSSGHDIDLAALVGQVHDPPFRKLGVYELDAFYPAKERSKLAATLNGLLASLSFAAWAEGQDIDVDQLLHAPDGKRPACAIVALSHLSDEERQFVMSLLLADRRAARQEVVFHGRRKGPGRPPVPPHDGGDAQP